MFSGLKMTDRKRHPFKWVKYKNQNIRIDKDIVSLLSKMWKLGINTTNSCQALCNFTCNHKYEVISDKDGDYYSVIETKHCLNNIWLCFESVRDVEKLYNIVAEYTSERSDEAMYHKMSCDRALQTGQTKFRHSKDGWAFCFHMANHGVFGHWGRPKWRGKRSTVEMWMEDGCGKNNFVLEPQITFPRSHLEYVESKLDQALKKKK
jgi:hypothetical protein